MEPTLRASMNWLHTWAGVVLGSLLMVVFWTGTLVVFDREIDIWMMPVTRVAVPSSVSLDALRPSLLEAVAAKAPVWTAFLPTERQPVARLRWRDGQRTVVQYFDFTSGVVLSDPGTLGGTYFLYPLHYSLHFGFRDIGIWLVGMTGMAMLVLCLSGVIVHRKIFADFFTFRTSSKSRRIALDLHNVIGVLGLPFNVAIALSGLIAFWSIYFPSTWKGVYESRQALSMDWLGIHDRATAKRSADIASLDALLSEVRRLWGHKTPRFVSIAHPGDANASVSFAQSYEHNVSSSTERLTFDGVTGAMLHHHVDASPAVVVQRFIMGLHLVQFRHWTLRWIYFVLGLMGCVLIATGYIFWLESRRKRHVQLGLSGVHIVEGLTIGSVTGIVIATLAFFVVNRLLPLGASFAWQDRAAIEIWAFYLVWFAAFVYAWLRPRRAWIVQCWVIAGLSVSAVVLNWVTTGDHLARTLVHRYLWPVGGMDVLLLIGATVAALTAHRLSHRPVT